MHPAFAQITHRPWPLPSRMWTWRQSWLDLAFIHYRVDAAQIQSLIPPQLRVQEFDGSAWLGLVPFRMAGVMRRPLPDLPFMSSFPELNLRTYVEVGDKPGVWFFSLDASSWPVVFGGRRFYGLPYFSASMRLRFADDWYHFSSVRRGGNAEFEAKYRPVGDSFAPRPGTFEHWAVERYCLYAARAHRGVSRVEVQHPPWPVQQAEAVIQECTMLSAAGLKPQGDAPIVHFSRGVHVVSYAPEMANQSPEPTIMSVTPRVCARVAPATTVAHL